MKRALIGITAFSLVALIVSLIIFIVDAAGIKWAILAGATGLVATGFAIHSSMLALRTDSMMNEIRTRLGNVEKLQEEMHEEQKEQSEQKSSGPPIVASLQALSQYYMDYINKQKGDADNEKS
ncbi:hypothetical protein ACFLYX_03275 [Chloroflexota bacterium]